MKVWKIFRCLMAVAGVALIYLGASTSDYYTLELRQPEPDYIWVTIVLGIILMLPSVVHAIRKGEL